MIEVSNSVEGSLESQNKKIKEYEVLPIVFPSVIRTYANKDTLLTDETIRLKETRNSILYTMSKDIFNKIVIIDGSNYKIFSDEEIAHFKRSGFEFEQIYYQQDGDGVAKYGKSYGECLLISYALSKSQILSKATGFYKLSPRYFFRNIKPVVSMMTGANIFFNYNFWPLDIKSPYTCTIFYKVSKDFYAKNLADSINQCSYERDGMLEAIFHRKLKVLDQSSLRKIAFPYFTGIAGTTGKAIKNRYYLGRNVASKIGLLAHSYVDVI